MPLSRRAALMGLSATHSFVDGAARAQDAGTKGRVGDPAKKDQSRIRSAEAAAQTDAPTEAEMIGINGATPGPLIRFKRGESVESR